MLLLLSFPRAVRAMACANHSLISSCFSSAYVEILSTWEVWRALKRLELHSAAPRATLTPLSCSPNFPRAQYLDIRTLPHELIVNYMVKQVITFPNKQLLRAWIPKYNYINTNETELSRENMISSQVKITCYLHT